MDRNDHLDEELDVRGGIDSFAEESDDTGTDEFFTDESQADESPQQDHVVNRRNSVPDYEADPVMQDSRRSCNDCRAKANRNSQAKDTLFAIMCVIIGLLGTIAIVVGVIIACGAYRPGGSQPQQTVQIPANLSSDDISVYYDPSGQMHINVYVEKRPDLDINVTIDENGQATVEAVVHDDENESTSENTIKPESSENVTEEPEQSENEKPDVTESDKPETSEDDPVIPETDSETFTGPITPEKEREILSQMEDKIAAGGSGYSESDETYTIVSGDTLTKISNETGFSVDFLAEYNHIQDKNLIITGETIRFPVFTPVN